MFRSFKKSLERRLNDLEKATTTASSCEGMVKDFVVGIFGFEALQFIKAVHQLPHGELLIITASKPFASELSIRKEPLLEYIKEKGGNIGSLRVQ